MAASETAAHCENIHASRCWIIRKISQTSLSIFAEKVPFWTIIALTAAESC